MYSFVLNPGDECQTFTQQKGWHMDRTYRMCNASMQPADVSQRAVPQPLPSVVPTHVPGPLAGPCPSFTPPFTPFHIILPSILHVFLCA